MGDPQSFRSALPSGSGAKFSIPWSPKAAEAEVQHSVWRAPLEVEPVSTAAKVHDEYAR